MIQRFVQFVTLLLLSSVGTSALANDTQPAPRREPAAISQGRRLAELDPLGLAARFQEAERELSGLERKVDVEDDVSHLASLLGALADRVLRDADRAEDELARAGRWSAVADICFQFVGVEVQLEALAEPVDRHLRELSRVSSRVEVTQAEWAEAAQILVAQFRPSPATRQAAHLAERASRLSARVRLSIAKLEREQAELGNLRSNVKSILATASESAPSVLSDYATRGNSPAEAVRSLGATTNFRSLLASSFHRIEAAFEGFVRTYSLRLTFHVLLWVALTVTFWRLKTASQPSGERLSLLDRLLVSKARAEPLQSYIVYRHPFAAGALLAGVLSAFLYPALPAAGTLLVVGVSVIASTVILMAERQLGFFGLGVLSLGLLAILAAHIAVDDIPALGCLLLAPEAVLVGLVAFRTAFRPALVLPGYWGVFKGMLGRGWLVLVVLGAVAWLLGYEVVAVAAISGTSRLILLTVAFQAGYSVAVALLAALFQSTFVLRSRAARAHGALLLQRSCAVVRWVLVGIWANAALNGYALRRDLLEAAKSLLAARWEIGTLSLSLGDLCVFALGLIVSFLAARLVQFLLDEELLPRSSLRVGTAAAVSSGVYFLLISTGLFMTVAAAGLKMEKFAIVVSALGVGIGFGLQNIVQNFVAGLILLFGRPINVSDIVQVDDLIGKVTKVGARASTIRTFTGAEVIVPNSTFVSEQVINWSLSDEHRRVELAIGVAYGTSPETVIELLTDVTKKHPDVLNQPPAEVIFLGFGDSSLNFQIQAWIARGERWMYIKSDLGMAAYAALNEAKIEIPFPQTDVHIRTA